MDIKCVTDVRAQLGESPVWSESEQVVYWIDILGRHLHRTDPTTGDTTTWDLPSYPGMIALRKNGGLVVALTDGLYAFEPLSGRLERLVPLEENVLHNRPNDGKADSAGRLWLGTMNSRDASEPTGHLYRIDTDMKVTRIQDGLRVPNGLAWSPDNDVMYHTDTRSGVVHEYAFDENDGTISSRRVFCAFDRNTEGGVDGAAMDAAGGYWAALYGGWKLRRLLPTGEIDTEITLPVSQPTMPAFGGPDRRTVFITSARQKLDRADLGEQPLAGALLAVSVENEGLPHFAFGG